MKKQFFLVILAIVTAMSASAVEMPEKRHSLELTFGDPMAVTMSRMFYLCGCGPAECWNALEDGKQPSEPHHGFALPTFNLNYHYAALPWLEVGASAGSTGTFTRYYRRAPMNTVEEVLFGSRYVYLMGDLRFTYWRNDIATLYSSLGLGICFDYHDVDHEPLGTRKLTVLPGVQLAALGWQVGHKVYWVGEIGVGQKGFINMGVGVRL